MTRSGEKRIDFNAFGAGWTAAEIAQQPALWRQVAGMVDSARAETDAFLGPLLERHDLRIVLTGAGTSAFAGEVLAPGVARLTGRRVDAIASTDLVACPRAYFTEDVPTLLVSFARSGDSPESVAGTRLAEQCLTRCHHLILTCNSDGELYRDHAGSPRSLVRLMPAAANDRGFAMTSSYTCMLLTALLTFDSDAGNDLADRLAAAAAQMLAEAPTVRAVAARGYRRIVYLGSGPLKGLARESALKMLELTAGTVATWWDSPLGFRHGPKAVLDEASLVIVFVSTDPYTRRYDLDLVAELRAGPGSQSVIVVTATATATAEVDEADNIWQVNGLGDVDDAAVSLPFVLFGQILALHVSIASGHAPDNPFPARQVNRVVQGVQIHPLPGRR